MSVGGRDELGFAQRVMLMTPSVRIRSPSPLLQFCYDLCGCFDHLYIDAYSFFFLPSLLLSCAAKEKGACNCSHR